jgi:membrane peptidoglycan carboxypeptidase
MVTQGRITQQAMDAAIQELLGITFKPVRETIRAPHFVLWARNQTTAMFQGEPDEALLEEGGLQIQTTLDWKLQELAEKIVASHKDDILKRFGANNIALLAADPLTGDILAYVGNADYGDDTKEGKIDMVQVPRQPGSSFKPFVYAAAFRNGVGPATILHDVPTKFGTYEPQNFEGDFWGVTSVRRALGGSRNIPAIKAYVIGGEEDSILDFVANMGVTTPRSMKPANGYGAALGIGAAETPLLEMVQGYATLAAAGTYRPLHSILKVTDKRGSLLHSREAENPVANDVIDPRIAYEVTSILSDPSARPTPYWRDQLTVPGVQAAAKTGTSNKCLERDEKTGNCRKRKPDNVWTLGYTPELVVGVWVGNATSDPLSEKADGLTVAAPIWKDFLVQALKVHKPSAAAFATPSGIDQVQISLLSGELPTECTPIPLRRSDIFLSENLPAQDDPACVKLLVDKVTGLLASDECPESAREERSFYLARSYKPETYPGWEKSLQDWIKSRARLPTTSSGVTMFLGGSGGYLPLPAAPTEKCSLALTPGRGVQPTLTVTYPSKNGTATYPSFQPKVQLTVGSRVREIRYEVDGKRVGLASEAPFAPVLRMPRSVEEGGTHSLAVTLTDEYYNVITAEVPFTFSRDAEGPSIRLTLPNPMLPIPAGSPLPLRAESDDMEGGIKYVEFYLDDTLLARKPVAPYALSYDQPIPVGKHIVRAVATDLAGNTNEDSVEVMVGE